MVVFSTRVNISGAIIISTELWLFFLAKITKKRKFSESKENEQKETLHCLGMLGKAAYR